ncbi:MAG: hypothetical protein RLZZ528_1846 [Pseudomonadota bacterium]
MRVLALLSLALMAACGAEGDPVAPAGKAPGVSVTGEVSTGVVVGG